MTIDHNNYHTLLNRYLTNSRMRDWLKDKKYFQEMHITGERRQKGTDALKIGLAVDTFIFFGEAVFRSRFMAVSRRNVKNPPENIVELTPKQFDDVYNMCKVLIRQPAFQALNSHTTQKIITMDMPIGKHFIGLAAIPDWYGFDKEDNCIITDLKTSYESDERKYHYKCLDYGYYRQFAVMEIILRHKYPGTNNFVFRHIGVEKDCDGIFKPFVFYLSNDTVNIFKDQVLKEIVPAIAVEKEFKPLSVSWADAVTIGQIDNF